MRTNTNGLSFNINQTNQYINRISVKPIDGQNYIKTPEKTFELSDVEYQILSLLLQDFHELPLNVQSAIAKYKETLSVSRPSFSNLYDIDVALKNLFDTLDTCYKKGEFKNFPQLRGLLQKRQKLLPE